MSLHHRLTLVRLKSYSNCDLSDYFSIQFVDPVMSEVELDIDESKPAYEMYGGAVRGKNDVRQN